MTDETTPPSKSEAHPNKHLSQPVKVCVVGKRCVYLNNYRIAGGKPYISENLPSHEFVTTMQSIVDAFGEEQLLAAVQERRAQREYFAALTTKADAAGEGRGRGPNDDGEK